jgi:drug/metabolite transporter (DMT)-like permease
MLVLSSGLLHAVWNILAKKSHDKAAFLWCVQFVAVIIQLPWAAAVFNAHAMSVYVCALLLLTMLSHGTYTILLAQTYRRADLSMAYPIMRGSSLLLVPLAGVILQGEHLTVWGWVGIFCIILGICAIGGNQLLRSSSKAVLLALSVGLAIACYTLLGKINLTEGTPPIVLNLASNFGNAVALSLWSVRINHIRSEWVLNRKTIVIAGLLAPGGYLLFLSALLLHPDVAQLAPMREIGTVFGAVLGVYWLKEKQGVHRVAMSVIITIGVLLLGFWGELL